MTPSMQACLYARLLRRDVGDWFWYKEPLTKAYESETLQNPRYKSVYLLIYFPREVNLLIMLISIPKLSEPRI